MSRLREDQTSLLNFSAIQGPIVFFFLIFVGIFRTICLLLKKRATSWTGLEHERKWGHYFYSSLRQKTQKKFLRQWLDKVFSCWIFRFWKSLLGVSYRPALCLVWQLLWLRNFYKSKRWERRYFVNLNITFNFWKIKFKVVILQCCAFIQKFYLK